MGESWEADEPTTLPTHCPFSSSHTHLRPSLHRSSAAQRCEKHKGNLPPGGQGCTSPKSHIMPFISCLLASVNSLVLWPPKTPPDPRYPLSSAVPFLPCFPWFLPPELLGLARCQNPEVKRSPDGGLGRAKDPRWGEKRDGAKLAMSFIPNG